ncbi:MAG: DNA alkylation repair protein [Longimicrobiales bacterium]
MEEDSEAAVVAASNGKASTGKENLQSARAVRNALEALADPEKAAFFPRFFRTGKGEYGEGDRFLGVIVPSQRKVARQARGLSHSEIKRLLKSPLHECRLTALFILVDEYQRGDDETRDKVAALYLDQLDRVNNWDLVDSSAHKILGRHLEDGDRGLLYELADSGDRWRERVSIIATHDYIRKGDFQDTLRLADKLLDHDHDLIHKAVGWMVREVGKVDLDAMEKFLKNRYSKMPRTMLRYAIEKLPEKRRKAYLNGKI